MKFLLLTLLLTSTAFAQTEEQKKAKMEAMVKLATPGEEHAFLKRMAGKWNVLSLCKESADAPTTESRSTSTNTMILGDRILKQEVKGDMMGMPFEGFGLTAYDNYKKKFVATWSDTMGTGIMVAGGTWDAKTNTMTTMGEYDDPATKKKIKIKMITRIESDTKHVFEMWHKDAKGKEFKSMDMTYTK